MISAKRLHAGALGVGLILATFAPMAPAAAAVLATVNGVNITDDDLRIAAQDLGDSIPRQLDAKGRQQYLLDYLIDGTLVAQKALQDKLDQGPDFAKELAYYRSKVLMEALLTKVAREAVTPENLQKTYEEAAKAQKPEEEIHARHILVATEAEAEAVEKRLKAGEDFAKVAKELSKDTGSDGGDLGWFTKEKVVPEFANAAFKLKVGDISAPVKSEFGWHIIQVLAVRQTQFPPFDQVKNQVTAYVIQKAQTELVESLRKDAKIVRTEPAPVPPASVPAPAPNKK
ncbi:peptidylprolyl isomerase [uncultured Methylovirgula sp.]|uniref:peptidylprolyl isomerase n=1 Tax=uncultured Methylovirgula sp. TaxID=1285960 RepID=UPI002615E24D|nr:peptidylprolyl isomerase [uncultured Methylovirgula sp.]